VHSSLTSRVRSGVLWNTLAVSSTYLSGLVRSIAMARLLAPDDFGLFGMALTVVTGLNALTTIGLDISVIKTKFKTDAELTKHLDTIWTVDLIRRLVLALLLLALAYPVSHFYRESRLYEILLLFSLLPFVQGFQNIGLLIYRKQVNFRGIVWLELATNFLTAATTIVLLVWTRNVWALVLSQLIAGVIAVALSYLFHPYRPRLGLDKEAFRLALAFGKYAVLIGVLGYVMQMADNILLGRLFNAAVLGTYVIAYNLATLPIYGIANVIAGVTFPAYAEIHGAGPGGSPTVREGPNGLAIDRGPETEPLLTRGLLPRGLLPRGLPTRELPRLERAFLRVFTLGSLLLALTSALLLLLGDEIVFILYGAKWSAAGAILRILAVLVFCRGYSVLISPLLVSIRGNAPDAKIKLFEAAIFLALLYPLTSRFAGTGAAWAGGIAFFVTMINRVYFATRLLPDIAQTIRRTILYSALATVAGIALGMLAIAKIENAPARLLLGGFAIGIGVTVALLLLLPRLRAEVARLFSAFTWRPLRLGGE
jgi:O-antigen/teichoic acid export membrane protein